MDKENKFENFDRNLIKLDRDTLKLDEDTIKTNRNLLILTRWITVLTIVMIFIGLIQVVVMWPKRTYCTYVTAKVQICEPDYYPYDTDPRNTAYQLDKKYNF
jgi:hypothetical protein